MLLSAPKGALMLVVCFSRPAPCGPFCGTIRVSCRSIPPLGGGSRMPAAVSELGCSSPRGVFRRRVLLPQSRINFDVGAVVRARLVTASGRACKEVPGGRRPPTDLMRPGRTAAAGEEVGGVADYI